MAAGAFCLTLGAAVSAVPREQAQQLLVHGRWLGFVRALMAQLHCCRKGTYQDYRMTIRRRVSSNLKPKKIL